MTTIKQWPAHVIESDGDYRNESFLEEYIGGPLYENQKYMKHLPIPDIDETIRRLLPTALSLAKTVEEKVQLIDACKTFPEEAQELQKRLIARKDGEFASSSWLQKWWNEAAYLQVRDPVVVNVSYFFGFVDDPTIDVSDVANIQRGAAMLYATAEFRKLVITGQLPYERLGKKQNIPVCSTAYKYMFNACRIPRYNTNDTYRIYDPSRYTHAIVARKGYFFSIELVDPQTGNPLPLILLEIQLQRCIMLADAKSSSNSTPKLGLLTSGNRDDWARDREMLLQAGGGRRRIDMERALEILESGAILVNLDDVSPVSRQECGEIFWTGGLSCGPNRWFDKSIQIMITNNGKAGLIAEHSMMDGMPVINFADYITKMTYDIVKKRSFSSGYSMDMANVKDIFPVSLFGAKEIVDAETKAWKAFHKLITDHTMHVQSFQGYGSSYIKKSGFPPDGFVQVAMQLATYRLFGEQVASYEATQVRTFLHGRTEVTRGASTDCETFIKRLGLRPKYDEMKDGGAIGKEKLQLLQKAVKTHSRNTSLAAKAQGVDRHLFGLSMMVQPNETAPTLFSNPVFHRSKRWRSSTSQLSHPRFNIWGYGEVVPDGVGLAYAILPNSCVFTITALKTTGWTDKLSELMEESLLEMKRIVEYGSSGTTSSNNKKTNKIQSKL